MEDLYLKSCCVKIHKNEKYLQRTCGLLEISFANISLVAAIVFLVFSMTVVSVDVVPIIVVKYLIETVLTISEEVKFGLLKHAKVL